MVGIEKFKSLIVVPETIYVKLSNALDLLLMEQYAT